MHVCNVVCMNATMIKCPGVKMWVVQILHILDQYKCMYMHILANYNLAANPKGTQRYFVIYTQNHTHYTLLFPSSSVPSLFVLSRSVSIHPFLSLSVSSSHILTHTYTHTYMCVHHIPHRIERNRFPLRSLKHLHERKKKNYLFVTILRPRSFNNICYKLIIEHGMWNGSKGNWGFSSNGWKWACVLERSLIDRKSDWKERAHGVQGK